jgi:nucleoid DNA-binding protein
MEKNNNKNKKLNLITMLMEESKCSKYEAVFWIRAINKAMSSLLKNNLRVYLRDLIIIKCVKSNSRRLRHHITKEQIILPAKMKPKAYFCKKIKEAIKENLTCGE